MRKLKGNSRWMLQRSTIAAWHFSMGGPSWHDAERVRNASSWGCGSVRTCDRWTGWWQEKRDCCHEMTCAFLPLTEHVLWPVSTPEYVSWVRVKLLTNYLLLCWCCVWCLNAYSCAVGPLCVSVVVSAIPWRALGKRSGSAWFLHRLWLFCLGS